MPGSITALLADLTPGSVVLRLVLATVCGGIIGIERETKRHSAGFRTFTLVCLGSSLATIVNIYLWQLTGTADAGRISAGVVSGVGFLGVGTIIVTKKNMVRGLTTAAGLWATACLGIAFGAGLIWTSLLAFALIMITMGVLSNLSRYIRLHNKLITLYVEIEKETEIHSLYKYFDKKGYDLISMDKKKIKGAENKDFSLVLEVDLKAPLLHDDIINDITKLDGIQYVEEIYS